MFQLICSIFTVFGLLTAIFSIIQFVRRSFADAAVLYPMYRDEGDAYFTLRTLSGLGLPLIVITDGNHDTTSLENEFLYANFVSKSDFEDYIKQRYQ